MNADKNIVLSAFICVHRRPKNNIAELVKALLAYNPFCRLQRASGETFAASGGMAQGLSLIHI